MVRISIKFIGHINLIFLGFGGWDTIVVTFDGGTTGSASGSINNYYSRFKSVEC